MWPLATRSRGNYRGIGSQSARKGRVAHTQPMVTSCIALRANTLNFLQFRRLNELLSAHFMNKTCRSTVWLLALWSARGENETRRLDTQLQRCFVHRSTWNTCETQLQVGWNTTQSVKCADRLAFEAFSREREKVAPQSLGFSMRCGWRD